MRVAGIYIPMLMDEIDQDSLSASLNLKGAAIGNGCCACFDTTHLALFVCTSYAHITDRSECSETAIRGQRRGDMRVLHNRILSDQYRLPIWAWYDIADAL
jgi:hypothetical protein